MKTKIGVIILFAVLLCGCKPQSKSESVRWEYRQFEWPLKSEDNYSKTTVYLLKMDDPLREAKWNSTNNVYSVADVLDSISWQGWELAWGSAAGDKFIVKRPDTCHGAFQVKTHTTFK